MNEIDGNLTLWAEAPYQIKLHWNRVRGPEFEPQYFRIERLSSPDIVDIKGAQILLPVLRTSSHQNVEDRQKQEANKDLALLRAMAANPDWSQGDLAKELGCSKSTVNGKLQSLKNGKFVEEGLGHKWRLTPKGMKEAEKS